MDVTSPNLGMVTRYGGKKPLPREIIGAVCHEDPTSWKAAMRGLNASNGIVRQKATLNYPNQSNAPLHAKWVFKTKKDENGNVESYKARMVARGNG